MKRESPLTPGAIAISEFVGMKTNIRRILCRLSWLGLAWFAAGCSSFNHDWKQAGATPPTDGLQGRWQGVWVSYVTGHTDQLRCLVTRKDDATYQARFRATY